MSLTLTVFVYMWAFVYTQQAQLLIAMIHTGQREQAMIFVHKCE